MKKTILLDGIVMIDTMLALVVFSIAILTTVMVIGHILHADARLKQVDSLAQRMESARAVILDTDFESVEQNTANNQLWQLDDTTTVERSQELSAQQGIALEVGLLGSDGTTLTRFGMIKLP